MNARSNCMDIKPVEIPSSSGLGFDPGHDQRVAGLSYWGCKYSFWNGVYVLMKAVMREQVSIPNVHQVNP